MHRSRALRLGLLAVVLAWPASVHAQGRLIVGDHHPIHIDSNGPSDVEPSITPTSRIYTVYHPDATYIALHFNRFDLGRGEYVVISDPSGNQAYTMEGKGKMGAVKFWARHVRGDTAVIELVTADQEPDKGFVIDEYAAGFVDLGTPDSSRAICGVDDKDNAICYETSHPVEYDHARAVARLLINGSSLCTGWLASSNNHLLTNEHCISSAASALNTDYEFMAEAPNCTDSNCQLCWPGTVFSGATFIQDNANLDYCLVQIDSGNPAATYGYMEIDDRVAVPGEQIYIPQHPGGRAKELGIFSSHSSDPGGICHVYSITEPPCSGSGYSDVGYFCDTEGGSSGSPVLATSTNKVIALHHCANCPNRGVPINLVYAEIGDIVVSSGLNVTPDAGLESEGDLGGPFLPDSAVYTLENIGDTSFDYTVTKTQPWVSLSDTGGPLGPGATTDVTVSINSDAGTLPEGMYSDAVQFTNTTDHVGDTIRSVDLTVGVPRVIYSWTFETDPGWTTEGLWAFGVPTGGGGQYGGPDPTSGFTGANVYGYNLSGDYENFLPELHLTTTPIDCSNVSAVTLRFQRWLGVEQPVYDHAYVRVSNNGTDWVTVWENTAEIADTSWVRQEIDISAVADNQPTVYLRWTMGTTDSGWQYCGWNLDDVEILALGGCNFNDTCEAGEDCATCPDDCFTGDSLGCGNGVCETILLEDCLSCPEDCNGKQGGKPSDRYCCGDGDGIGPVGCADPRCTGSGNTCSDFTVTSSCCGDLVCEGWEDSLNCSVDCGACGNGTCEPGEDSCSCPADCGAPPPTETDCTDGIDNDCDGLLDCDDAIDCGADPACVCLGRGESCTDDGQCCSNRCHRGACK